MDNLSLFDKFLLVLPDATAVQAEDARGSAAAAVRSKKRGRIKKDKITRRIEDILFLCF